MAENGRLLCDYEDRVVGIRGLNRMTCTCERDRYRALNSLQYVLDLIDHQVIGVFCSRPD